MDYHGTPTEQLERLFRDCGVSSSQVGLFLRSHAVLVILIGEIQVQDLMQDLPGRDLAENMVGWYFDKVNYVRYPIEESLFRRGQSLLMPLSLFSPEQTRRGQN